MYCWSAITLDVSVLGTVVPTVASKCNSISCSTSMTRPDFYASATCILNRNRWAVIGSIISTHTCATRYKLLVLPVLRTLTQNTNLPMCSRLSRYELVLNYIFYVSWENSSYKNRSQLNSEIRQFRRSICLRTGTLSGPSSNVRQLFYFLLSSALFFSPGVDVKVFQQRIRLHSIDSTSRSGLSADLLE